jgi:hypothetical protein
MVVVVMVVANGRWISNWVSMPWEGEWVDILMVMVMSVRLGTLRFTSRRHPVTIVVIVIALGLFVFGLPALSPRFRGYVISYFLMGRLDIITSKVRIRKGDLDAGWPRARNTNTTHTTPYAREHATKLALDPRFPCRALRHRLCPLNCLGQGRYPSLAVHFLYPQEASLGAPVGWAIIHRSGSPRFEDGRTGATIIRNRRWRRAVLPRSSSGRCPTLLLELRMQRCKA